MKFKPCFRAVIAFVAFSQLAQAAPPSFEGTSQPAGWTVARGQTMQAAWLQSQDGAVNTRKDAKALLLQTAAPRPVPHARVSLPVRSELLTRPIGSVRALHPAPRGGGGAKSELR